MGSLPARWLLSVHVIAIFQGWLQQACGFRSNPQGQRYTKNILCLPNFCVNPIVPGLLHFGQNVLTLHENKTWACSESRNMWRRTGICQRVVAGYHFSLPEATVDGGQPANLADIANSQASQALAAYVAHLAGMGLDFWEYTEPWAHSECIKSIWRMVCYTYFPRCNTIEKGKYLRPCKTPCRSYLRACQVECCDDGIQCVFEHARQMPDGSVLLDEGYADHEGPSPLCTGGVPALLQRTHRWVVAAAAVSLLAALPPA